MHLLKQSDRRLKILLFCGVPIQHPNWKVLLLVLNWYELAVFRISLQVSHLRIYKAYRHDNNLSIPLSFLNDIIN